MTTKTVDRIFDPTTPAEALQAVLDLRDMLTPVREVLVARGLVATTYAEANAARVDLGTIRVALSELEKSIGEELDRLRRHEEQLMFAPNGGR